MKTLLIAAALLLAAAEVRADETTIQFRSEEDPAVTPDLSVCAAAPFRFNVRLTASVWVHRNRANDGQIVNDSVQKIGTAHACAQLTNFTFPPGLAQNFYVKFNLPQGSFTALGTCTLISNDVPQKGLVLAGCNLKVTDRPAAFVGGVATSTSVFNPFRLPGFSTGSYWTLHLYDAVTPSVRVDHSGHDKDLEDVQDDRTDDEIAAKK